MTNHLIDGTKVAMGLSQIGHESIVGRGDIDRLPDKEAAGEGLSQMVESVADSAENTVSGSSQEAVSKATELSQGAAQELPSWEQIDGPMAAGGIASAPFVIPSAQGAIKGLRSASSGREALMKGTAGAIEGLGAPGRFFGGGVHTSDKMPLSLPGSVQQLKDSYGFGRSRKYYEDLAQKARDDRPDQERLEELFGDDVVLQGSTGLGINVPGQSDTDVLIPKPNSEQARNTFESILDEHGISANSNHWRSHNVATGKVDGEKMDIVTGSRPQVHDRVEAYEDFNQNVPDVEKGMIIDQKKKLNSTTGGPYADGDRYMQFKQEVDQNYGIPRLG